MVLVPGSGAGGGSINVPPQYQGYLETMAAITGIPYSVEAAQAYIESNFNAKAVSPAGAEGWLQFLPSTYRAYAAQAGVPTGSEFNPQDETAVYDVFMKQLLQTEGGNIYKALEAYNAGAGNLSAGAGYATQILNLAGVSTSATATPGANQTTPSSNLGGEIGSAITGAISSFWDTILGNLGLGISANQFGNGEPAHQITPGKDALIRLALLLVGGVLLFMGISMFINVRKTAGSAIEVAGIASGQPEIAAAGSVTRSQGISRGSARAVQRNRESS